MKRPRVSTPAQLAAIRKASKASPWRWQSACGTARAKECNASFVERLSKRWGKE